MPKVIHQTQRGEDLIIVFGFTTLPGYFEVACAGVRYSCDSQTEVEAAIAHFQNGD